MELGSKMEVLTGMVKLSVVDMMGKEVMVVRKDANSINNINVNALADGNYILNISNDDYLIAKRFTVSR